MATEALHTFCVAGETFSCMAHIYVAQTMLKLCTCGKMCGIQSWFNSLPLLYGGMSVLFMNNVTLWLMYLA
jgi:hypothetical protein